MHPSEMASPLPRPPQEHEKESQMSPAKVRHFDWILPALLLLLGVLPLGAALIG